MLIFLSSGHQLVPGSEIHQQWLAYKEKVKTSLECFQVREQTIHLWWALIRTLSFWLYNKMLIYLLAFYYMYM